MRARTLLLVAVGLAAAACSVSSVDETGRSDSAQTGATPLEAIKGREWARCFFQNGTDLVCTSTKRDAKDPLTTSVKITATTLNPFASAEKTLDTENGGTVVVGSFPRASFPVIVIAEADLPSGTGESLGLTRARDLQTTFTVNTPEQLAPAQPFVMKQPFDLWPTALIAERAGGTFAVNARYEVSSGTVLAPFASQPVLPIEVGYFSNTYNGKIRYWVAPASGGIAISSNDPIGSITGPGYWTVAADGLRAATTTEIARDFPSGPDDAPDASPGASPDASPDVAPAPVDPTPGCGGNGEAYCRDANGTAFCDANNRIDSNAGKCVACGNDGQTYCYDANNNRTCNAGTRYDGNATLCRACGNDGQTYCYDANNNRTCNAGTRYDGNATLCRACGNDGQTYCYDANNNRTCNAGTRYDGNATNCRACGKLDQTYCYDANNNRVCDAGLRYDGNAEKCVTQ